MQDKITVDGDSEKTSIKSDVVAARGYRSSVSIAVTAATIPAPAVTSVATATVIKTAKAKRSAKQRVTTALICTITHILFIPLGYLRSYLIVYYMAQARKTLLLSKLYAAKAFSLLRRFVNRINDFL